MFKIAIHYVTLAPQQIHVRMFAALSARAVGRTREFTLARSRFDRGLSDAMDLSASTDIASGHRHKITGSLSVLYVFQIMCNLHG